MIARLGRLGLKNEIMRVLNLYAGIGGNRKLWQDVEVTAVEYNQEIADIYKDFFPDDTIIVADAHQYLLEHFKEFDFIWSSPPCQSHSRLNTMLNKNGINRYPDMSLYQQILFLSHWFYGKFVVENVKPYYEPLIKPIIVIDRHLFWTNIKSIGYNVKDKRQAHMDITNKSEVYGICLDGYNIQGKEQILKNMVNPEIGLHFLNRARDIKADEETQQQTLF